MVPLATHCHTHYHLHPFHFVLFKFKDLVAKQHPTNIHTQTYTHIHTHTYTYIHTHTYTYTHTYIHKHTGAHILIDAKAQLSLLGTEMDYVETKLSSEFIFNNPNVKGTCGCGESFTV